VGEISLKNKLEDLLKKDAFELIRQENSNFDQFISSTGESYVLFGAGRLGITALAGLRKIGIEPFAFTDNNPILWDKSVEGLLVVSPQDAVKLFGQKAIFVITVYTSSQVWDQLVPFGIKIVSFAELAWKYSKAFLPYWAMELPYKIFNQADDVEAAFKLWADDISRREYLGQLLWRTSLDRAVLPNHLPQEDIYFPDDIFTPISSEVFVDCGAYDGDTIREFMKRKKSSFSQIIAIEPDPVNFQSLNIQNSYLAEEMKNKIILMQYAVGSHKEIVKFNSTGTVASSVGQGSYNVECMTLDELLANYKPTFIKMDIEGAELDALKGAQKIIGECPPILAICTYHKQEHLWKIPLLLRSFSDQYNFFLRRYADECWELVCYAVPVNRSWS
jgi:FkbM family methyltransferase